MFGDKVNQNYFLMHVCSPRVVCTQNVWSKSGILCSLVIEEFEWLENVGASCSSALYNIMLTGLWLPAKQPCHMYNNYVTGILLISAKQNFVKQCSVLKQLYEIGP